MEEQQVDLRKDTRFKTRDGSAAALKNEISSKLGIITDISRGGLAFRYLAHDLEHEDESEKPFVVNILHEADGFLLSNVPCKIIKNNYTPPEYSFSLGLIRKCSVQFGELSSNQKSQLEYFISHFTKGTILNRLILPPMSKEQY